MTSGRMDLLRQGALHLGIPLTDSQLDAFESYARELVIWNRRVNLTAITDYEAIQVKHFLDSLTCGPVMLRYGLGPGASLMDVGAGAGFPGVPLKIAFPYVKLTLLDSVAKKTAFLQHLVQVLGLQDVEVVTARAEDAARQPRYRERYDYVLARALADLDTLVELALPFCRVGGLLIAPRKGDIQAEIEEAEFAIGELGGAVREVVPVTLPMLADGRVLVVIGKERPTPGRYPRRAGIPEKRPLRQR